VQPVNVDVDEIIQDVWDELRFDLNASSIKLVKSLPERMVITTDKDRLKIILSNLFSNSIKYANSTIEYPRVVASGEINDGFLCLEVADNGIGIDDQDQSKIFDMFYRATEKASGSGLGLFIVKETIEKLKGDIQMSSELGKGTTFNIKIPSTHH
jgi:signal transduction histidine kinase